MWMLYVSCQHASAKQGGLCSPCQGSSAALARPQRGAVLCTGTIHQEFSSPDTAVGLISIQSICTGISEAGKESVRGTNREGKASLRNSLWLTETFSWLGFSFYYSLDFNFKKVVRRNKFKKFKFWGVFLILFFPSPVVIFSRPDSSDASFYLCFRDMGCRDVWHLSFS